MGRKSKQAQITTDLRAYLAKTETQPVSENKLDVKHVARVLGVSRTSLYTYGLVSEIQAAALRQQKQTATKTTALDQIQQLRLDLQLAETRNKALLVQLHFIEANAARLGIDPESLYQPLVKPARSG